jgi:hypothetical protein
MQNSASFMSYEDLIKQGWYKDQYAELARDLEILERYGHLTTGQCTHLLSLARRAQDGSLNRNPAPPAQHPRPRHHPPSNLDH